MAARQQSKPRSAKGYSDRIFEMHAHLSPERDALTVETLGALYHLMGELSPRLKDADDKLARDEYQRLASLCLAYERELGTTPVARARRGERGQSGDDSGLLGSAKA